MKKIILLMLAIATMSSVKAQEVISLPKPEVNKLSMSLGDALQQRRSQRQYSSQEIDLQTLSTLLWAACGISDQKRGLITAPSAINMQDIKVYVCSKTGACLYDAKANTLIKVTDKDLLAANCQPPRLCKDGPCLARARQHQGQRPLAQRPLWCNGCRLRLAEQLPSNNINPFNVSK